MKFRLTNAFAGLVFLGATLQASAATVDVSYIVSGSPGNWTYDVTLTNNFGGSNYIYAVVLNLPSVVAGSPSGWGPGIVPNEWCYASNCGFFGPTNLAPGQTLGGFLALTNEATPSTTLEWFAYAEGGEYLGNDNITGNPFNPGVTGVANATPLPAALPLFASGLGALGLLGWRRKRKATHQTTRRSLETVFLRAAAFAIIVATGIFSSGEPTRAIPVQYAGTGNYYEFVNTGGNISWSTASTNAALLTYLGASGHLATVTSAGENAFLVGLIASPPSTFLGAWLGGTSTSLNVWTWAVGPEAGQAFSYTNWNAVEPNNPPARLYMDMGTTGPNGATIGKWFDALNGLSTFGINGNDPVTGYFVEYEISAATPLPATLPLFATGLGALGLLGWRRKRKQAA